MHCSSKVDKMDSLTNFSIERLTSPSNSFMLSKNKAITGVRDTRQFDDFASNSDVKETCRSKSDLPRGMSIQNPVDCYQRSTISVVDWTGAGHLECDNGKNDVSDSRSMDSSTTEEQQCDEQTAASHKHKVCTVMSTKSFNCLANCTKKKPIRCSRQLHVMAVHRSFREYFPV